MQYLIYGLLDPISKQLRYVGKSCSGLKRPKQHLQTCYLKRKTYCSSWIKSLLIKNLKPLIIVIEETDSKDSCADLEIFYISYFRAIGAELTNLTNGGDGRSGYHHTKESKLRISKQMTGNKFNCGRKLTEEHKKALKDGRKFSKNSAKHNAAISKALKGRKLSDEHKRKISISRTSKGK